MIFVLALVLQLPQLPNSLPPKPPKPPPAPPAAWLALSGAYAAEHDTLYVYEDRGALALLVKPAAPAHVVQTSESVFTFTGPRIYDAERGAFLAPDLIEPARLDSTIHLDVRYATTNNFLGSVFYSSVHAFLQRPAAQALVRAARALSPLGYGLLIHDAYRPWYLTKVFWDATPPQSRWLVADPGRGSKHNRGAAVDITLYDLATGQPVEMPSTYDEATPRAVADFPGGTSRQRWHRALLRRVLEAQGFTVNPSEWWHFDYRDWQRYPILNRTFEDLLR